MTAVSFPKDGVVVESPEEQMLFSKINWRILPLLLVAYCFAFIDRVNIGFAQLQMRHVSHVIDARWAHESRPEWHCYIAYQSNIISVQRN
ncbi:hypothetical protein ACU4GD_31715 [Cupriavidus basilensis]|uniref:hypothetical protein n=1 Tax=Cupriavidus sp. TaxID=1873897 RepID=UPI003D0C0F60